MYNISGVLPGESASELRPGTSLLIEAPAMSGKRTLAVELLSNGFDSDDGVLYVTTDSSVADITDRLRRANDGFDTERVGLVDCSGASGRGVVPDVQTHRVGSPADLTGISIATVKIIESFSARDVTNVRHGVDSLSTLLQYLDVNTVFKFLHIYTNRITDSEALGVFTVDNTVHEERVLNTIRSKFDGVIELRESESDSDGQEIRVRGLPGVSRSWRSY